MRITLLLLFLSFINAQIALPTFQAVHKTHTTTAESDSQTFSYTGSEQTFTVPSGVSTITITAYGAAGGESAAELAGGQGAIIRSSFSVTSGDNLIVFSGGKGGSTSYGTSGCHIGGCMQGEGGDGSYVSQNGDPLIIAGGGGGSVHWSGERPGANASYGESGSTSVDGCGSAGTNGNNGGALNYSHPGNGWNGDPKCVGGNTIHWNSNGGSGAGGGGYSGGGSGSSRYGGGGGGGSYTDDSGSTQQNIGYNDGNGQVIISW
jgi:hypothetical protein